MKRGEVFANIGDFWKTLQSKIMNTTEIVTEINRLPLAEKIYVVELVLKTIRRETQKNQSLSEGAASLAADYETDAELTAFTALDAQDFYEAK